MLAEGMTPHEILDAYPYLEADDIPEALEYAPIARRGWTATPVALDYSGKPMFLVDAPVFVGSSGSPVFVLDEACTRRRMRWLSVHDSSARTSSVD
jgi:hypothetical protein